MYPLGWTALVLCGATAITFTILGSATAFFFVSLTFVMICGANVAILSGAIFALSASLEHNGLYTQAVMSGQAWAGIIVCASSIVTKLAVHVDSNGHQVHTSALIYFLIAAVVLTAATLAFLVLERLPVTRYYAKMRTPIGGSKTKLKKLLNKNDDVEKGAQQEADLAAGGLVARDGGAGEDDFVVTPVPVRNRGYSWPEDGCNSPLPDGSASKASDRSATLTQSLLQKSLSRRPSIYLMTPNTFSRARERAASMRGPDEEHALDGCAGILSVLSQLGWYAFCVFFTFLVTLAVFPVITSIKSVDPSKGRLFQDLYSSFLLLLFNFGDLIGRTLSVWAAPWMRGGPLAVAAVLRIGFIPLLLCCNTVDHVSSHHHHHPYGYNDAGGLVEGLGGTFNNDVAPMIIILFYAITNGLLASASMMKGPGNVKKAHEPYAGTIMSLMMQIGLTLGSALSFAIKEL